MPRPKWQPGQSGNPNGRPPGTTLGSKLRDAVGAEFDAILRAVITAAKTGDMQAASILLTRVCAPLKPIQEPVKAPMPGKTLADKAAALLDAIAEGHISPTDGKQLIDALGSVAKITEFDDLLKRVEALEEMRR